MEDARRGFGAAIIHAVGGTTGGTRPMEDARRGCGAAICHAVGGTTGGARPMEDASRGSGSSTGTWPGRRQALEDGYAELVKLAVESRSRIEESRLLWQLYWDMAEEETGSGGRLRRAGQAGHGEEKQARGEQAALTVLLEHGRGGGGLWRTPTPSWSSWPWRGGAGSRRAGCSGSSTETWPRRRQALWTAGHGHR